MTTPATPPVGTINWFDLTVADADAVRDFYADVVGWTVEPLSMGDYSDYVMKSPETGAPVAGVCHARGQNAGLPAQWLLYVQVADVDASAARCVERGGRILAPPRSGGPQGRYCVIQDPAGAAVALYGPPAPDGSGR